MVQYYELFWLFGVVAFLCLMIWALIKFGPILIKAAFIGAVLVAIAFVGFYAYKQSDVRVSDYKSLIN